ncbi:CocE/NonD family hydrolase [Kitasatospora sp. NPDC050543]|uniref:CocE/NonD family hydrolase n=1 Tax=Kitasatospora sp. NPDC050543 TaxID=3364054 RepID=UPI0037BBE04D
MTHPHRPRTGGRRRSRAWATTTAIVTALVVTGPALAVPASAAAGAGSAPATATAVAGVLPGFRLVDIAMTDGVVLKANVFTPPPGTPGADAQGRYPAIVQPASWGQNDLEYVAQGRQLAADGYVAVTYTVRGFWLSGGEIDVAGPKDVADISAVIDWTLAHTPADPQRLGMTGLSLGGGLTLLGAAFDPRIKAVAALSGWGDLTDSLYSGETRHLKAASLLTAIQTPTGRRGPELERTLAQLFEDRSMDEVVEWARTRSPSTYLDRINAHGTAVFLANAWGDAVFNPSQAAAFYDRLSGPKRLELRPGDHATQELTSLLGLPNPTWASARGWFDEHLKGRAGRPGKPVELEVRPGGTHESYADWRSVGSRSESLRLGAADALGTGALGGAAGTGWRTSVVGGRDSGANGGIPELSGLLDQVAKLPPTVVIPLLPRSAGAVWQSAPSPAARDIRGTVRLHTTVTASSPRGTVIGYLYDVNAFGVGKLVSHAPQSWSGKEPGQAFPLDIALFATAYDLPAGHRLAVVLDTTDPLYGSSTPAGSEVTFSSPAADPSELTLPLR